MKFSPSHIFACRPAPTAPAAPIETLGHLHDTRPGDWLQTVQDSRDSHALESPAEARQEALTPGPRTPAEDAQAQRQFTAISLTTGILRSDIRIARCYGQPVEAIAETRRRSPNGYAELLAATERAEAEANTWPPKDSGPPMQAFLSACGKTGKRHAAHLILAGIGIVGLVVLVLGGLGR